MAVDSVQFTTLRYTTKTGENVVATRRGNVVTIVGDQSGVQQLPMDQFMRKMVTDLPQSNINQNSQPKDKSSKKGFWATVGVLLLGAAAWAFTKGKVKKLPASLTPITNDIAEVGSKAVKPDIVETVIGVTQPKGVTDEVAEIIAEVFPEKSVSKATKTKKPYVAPTTTSKAKTKPSVATETTKKSKESKPVVEEILTDPLESIAKQNEDLANVVTIESAKNYKGTSQTFAQQFFKGGKLSEMKVPEGLDDALEEVADAIKGKLKPNTSVVADVVDDVADEGATAATKIFGQGDELAHVTDDVTGVFDGGVPHSAPYSSPFGDLSHQSPNDLFKTQTDELFEPHTDKLFELPLDGMYSSTSGDLLSHTHFNHIDGGYNFGMDDSMFGSGGFM